MLTHMHGKCTSVCTHVVTPQCDINEATSSFLHTVDKNHYLNYFLHGPTKLTVYTKNSVHVKRI